MAGAQAALKPEVIVAEIVDEEEEKELLAYSRQLSTLPQIRAEMARVYRATRRGSLTTQEGMRLIYMLDKITRNIEVESQQKLLANVDTPAFVGLVLQIGKSE